MTYDDPIGFDPSLNQSEAGTPRTSPYGTALRATAPMAAIDYFATYPLQRGSDNYGGTQEWRSPDYESIYAEEFGYQGVAPIRLQPMIDAPLPYETQGPY